LPDVEQVPTDYDGSFVKFPIGTAARVVRLMELLRIKEKFENVGWELWWEGYDDVGEKWWKPKLQDAAEKGDAALKQVRRLLGNWSSGGTDLDQETGFDQLEREAPANALGWQLARRLKVGETATYLRILSEVASGKFAGFDDGTVKDDGSDYDIAIRSLDLERSENYPGDPEAKHSSKPDLIYGRDLKLISTLPEVLSDFSRVLQAHGLGEALNFPIEDLRVARDDVRGALQIGTDLYDVGSWVFGSGAFGLRIVRWLSERPASQRAAMILGFALLRRSKHPLLASAQIAVLAKQAEQAKSDFAALRRLADGNPKLATLITPKAVRRAFRSQDEFQRFTARVAAASMK
jgi:hypothetical protein